MKSEKTSTIVFPTGRSVVIRFLNAGGGPLGLSISFHLWS